VRRRLRRTGVELLAQAGHADLEELVEHAREDRQEVDPIEGRVAGVARLEQHPGRVVEPGQLAVDVRPLRCGALPGRSWPGRCAADGRGNRGHRVVRAPARIVTRRWAPGRSDRVAENSTCPRWGNWYGCRTRALLASLVPVTAPRGSPAR